MTPSTRFWSSVGLKKVHIGRTWFPLTVIGLCSFVGLLLTDIGWAAPKKGSMSVTCRCTCMYEDELGKVHYGPSQGVQFTESTGERCLNHACKSGSYSGRTRDCLFTENPQMSISPGAVQGQLQPATPGRIPAPVAPGTIMRRGTEGDQPTSSEKEGK
ncbi:MAG: hypothetical protein QM771_10775 [Nitrospira sp.]